MAHDCSVPVSLRYSRGVHQNRVFEGFPKYLRGRSEGLELKIQFEFEGLSECMKRAQRRADAAPF